MQLAPHQVALSKLWKRELALFWPPRNDSATTSTEKGSLNSTLQNQVGGQLDTGLLPAGWAHIHHPASNYLLSLIVDWMKWDPEEHLNLFVKQDSYLWSIWQVAIVSPETIYQGSICCPLPLISPPLQPPQLIAMEWHRGCLIPTVFCVKMYFYQTKNCTFSTTGKWNKHGFHNKQSNHKHYIRVKENWMAE